MSFELGVHASRVSCRAASNSATELLTEAACDAIALQRCRRSWRQTKESPALMAGLAGQHSQGGGGATRGWVSCYGEQQKTIGTIHSMHAQPFDPRQTDKQGRLSVGRSRAGHHSAVPKKPRPSRHRKHRRPLMTKHIRCGGT